MEDMGQQAGQRGRITLTFLLLSLLYGARTTLASNFGGVLGKQVCFHCFFIFFPSGSILERMASTA